MEGSGITKRAAKEAAAQVALQALRGRDHEEQVRDALKTQRQKHHALERCKTL